MLIGLRPHGLAQLGLLCRVVQIATLGLELFHERRIDPLVHHDGVVSQATGGEIKHFGPGNHGGGVF